MRDVEYSLCGKDFYCTAAKQSGTSRPRRSEHQTARKPLGVELFYSERGLGEYLCKAPTGHRGGARRPGVAAAGGAECCGVWLLELGLYVEASDGVWVGREWSLQEVTGGASERGGKRVCE